MNAREALAGLEPVGGAEGLKQTYEVLRGKRHYIVGSTSRVKRRSGNFNIVSGEAVEAAGDTVVDLRVERPALEERFLQITGDGPAPSEPGPEGRRRVDGETA